MLNLQKKGMWTEVKEISKTHPMHSVRIEAKGWLSILNTKNRYMYFSEVKQFIQKYTQVN